MSPLTTSCTDPDSAQCTVHCSAQCTVVQCTESKMYIVLGGQGRVTGNCGNINGQTSQGRATAGAELQGQTELLLPWVRTSLEVLGLAPRYTSKQT